MKKTVSTTLRTTFIFLCLLEAVTIANAMGAGQQAGYIENRGQWEPSIRYYAPMKGMNLWVTGDALIYDVAGSIEKTGRMIYKPTKFSTINDGWIEETIMHRHAIRVEIEGAHLQQTTPANIQDGTYNYFPEGHSSAAAISVGKYSDVRIREVYTGIDMLLTTVGGLPRYDFVVKPGASAQQIVLNVHGASALATQADGSLRMSTTCGDIVNGNIYAYQKDENDKSVAIPCVMIADGNKVTFHLGAYDTRKELVIDPTVYATYLGGDDVEVVNAITRVANTDQIVAVGYTTSFNFPKTSGAYTTSTKGLEDFFVAKLDAKLQKLIFATYFGGGNTDIATGVAISKDDASAIYVCGHTGSPNLAGSGALGQLQRGNSDAFVFKLSAAGDNRLFATYYGGSNNDYAYGIDIDGDGSAYICGETNSTNIQCSSGAFSNALGGGTDGFVAKISSTGGVLEFGSYIGGSGADRCNAVSVYNEQAYVTGETKSSNFPVQNQTMWWLPQPAQAKLNGIGSGPFSDAFVAKFNPAGSQLPSCTYMGGNEDDAGFSINVDNQGTALVGGMTKSTNLPLKRNFQFAKKGGADGMIGSMSADGREFLYMTYFGGDGEDAVYDVKTDGSSGSIYAVGRTFSANFPVTSDAGKQIYGGAGDGYVAKIAYEQLRYVSFVGDSLEDEMRSVVMLNPLSVYIGGTTSSRSMPISDTAAQSQYLGSGDGYIAKYVFSSLNVNSPLKDVSYCAGSTVAVSWNGSVFTPTEPYSVEVSSDNGVTWSTLKSKLMAGSYNWIIPQDQPAGGQYRIRVTHENTGYAVENPGTFIIRRSAEILSRSADTSLCMGTPFTLAVSAVGDGIEYQWRKDGAELTGETNPVVTVNDAKPVNTGVYEVVVKGACGAQKISEGIRVTVNPPPTITMDLTEKSVKVGEVAVFEVKVSGKNLTYKWQKDGVNIGGAPSLSQYSIPTSQELDQGYYRVIVSGDCGADTSAAVKLTVSKNTVGVDDTDNSGVGIQPNPSDEYIRISIKGLEASANVKVSIIDNLGNNIYSCSVGENSDKENVLVPVYNVAAGTYRVVVEHNGKYIATGLVVLH